MDEPHGGLYISDMTTPAPDTAIRTWNLFGETEELADVVHCERIATRSRLHNWELDPHRHARLHQILMLDTGGGRARIEDRQIDLHPGTVLNIPRGLVHGFRFLEGSQGWVVTLTSDLVDETLRAGEGIKARIGRFGRACANDDMKVLARRIFAEHAGRRFGRAQVLRSLSGVLLALVARGLEADEADEFGDASPLLGRFEDLIDRHFADRWQIADYAAALGVSPTHLGRVVRQATGHSANRLIADRVLREARRMLIFTNLPVAQIGYQLGFADPAHFSRVFRRGAGMPPSAFRTMIEDRS